MRSYDAPLISRKVLSLGAVQIEMIERQLDGGRAALHVCLPDHMLFLELTAGATCERRIDGEPAKRFDSKPGLFSFRPAGSETRGWTEGSGTIRYGAIRIDQDGFDGEGAARTLPGAWRPATACDDRAVWRAALPSLRLCDVPLLSERPFARLYADGHAMALLAVLAERFGRSPITARSGLPQRRLQNLVDFIDANLGGDVNLTVLASIAKLSRSQFVRASRASTGFTPIDYVIRRRLEEARRMLLSTDAPLAEIAVRLGFADQSHFTRRFRVANGMTPAQFRRQAK